MQIRNDRDNFKQRVVELERELEKSTIKYSFVLLLIIRIIMY